MEYRIRPCTPADTGVIDAIINDAAIAYKGVIPADCWHEPYMSRSELEAEIDAGVQFWAWESGGEIQGIMGLQAVKDVTLIRHAYVRTAQQGRGIGGALLDSLTNKASTALLVGTWADAAWAIRLYERHGFSLVDRLEKDRLLDRYWTISPRQRETSVVLRFEGH
ncbi:MAG TPA: GNAT family N-acetyltransferase [Candidatus Baltobacteraceae bacterium]|nr:GNAT family N-acetyltransferase [Candidatus Baltobacteraceae bacterium]